MRKTIAVLSLILWLAASGCALAESIACWFPPEWKSQEAKAKAITQALSANSGVTIHPRIAGSYPEILEVFAGSAPNLVYAGSFVQAIIAGRKLGTPLAQNTDGREMYSGILVYPKGKDPEVILKQSPQQIAFARGASSGESTALAATGAKAAIAVVNHGEAVKAVLEGRAQAAVVKDWWWLSNEKSYAGLQSYRIPGLSVQKNPDNVLTASHAVPKPVAEKIALAALTSSAAFGDKSVVLPFDASQLQFTLGLMKSAGIDPQKYSW